MKKKKKKYQPKLTAEEYEKLTGQGLGSLYNGSTSTVNNIDTTH
jgi:hypothetical protein